MPDDLENLLRSYRPAAPPPHLRDRILHPDLSPAISVPRSALRRWPTCLYRSAVAAVLLLSLGLMFAANRLNDDSASRIGIGPPRWTPEAQQAADLLGNDAAARRYVALCLIAGNAPATPRPNQGAYQ